MTKDSNVKEKIEIVDEMKEENNFLDELQRVQAEFENYVKRVHREKEKERIHAKSELLLKLINIKEDFERVLNGRDDEALKMILNNIVKTLEEENVKEIESLGEKFNYELHEVVKKIEGEEDKILDVVQRGYLLGDKILKIAKVVIGGKNE
ncbi:nucleotide exchange factor GrpE [Candidatus Woesearchaeota archaeon]|nr:nucleotide exchange factor GrpE [Candidatus Woesearchaeota archaeon]